MANPHSIGPPTTTRSTMSSAGHACAREPLEYDEHMSPLVQSYLERRSLTIRARRTVRMLSSHGLVTKDHTPRELTHRWWSRRPTPWTSIRHAISRVRSGFPLMDWVAGEHAPGCYASRSNAAPGSTDPWMFEAAVFCKGVTQRLDGWMVGHVVMNARSGIANT